MKRHANLSLMLLLTVVSCRTSGPNRGDGSAVSSFTIGKFTPAATDPSWAKMQVLMPRLDGDLKKIDQTFALADFQSGTVQNQTILIPQGKYNINLIYKGASDVVVYEACNSIKADVYNINTPTFKADIAICKAGTNTQAGTVAVTSNSDVTITPHMGNDTGTGGGPAVPASPGGVPANPGASGTSFTAFASNFDAVATPTGGCGVPEAQLDSQDYVALNVQYTPKDYTVTIPRPNPDAATVGMWANGLNCGRWVRVTIKKDCQNFINSGATAANLCPEANLVASGISDATLDMIVADSCQDSNGWCRDDQYHLDLHTASLARFSKAGSTINIAANWANPQISWQFIKAPAYSGDIKIGFGKDWQKFYLPIILTHFENGLHKVEVKVGGAWQVAGMNGDNGQKYLLPSGADVPYQIRLYDAADQLVNGGRVYQFNLPAACASVLKEGKCPDAYTAVTYTAQ